MPPTAPNTNDITSHVYGTPRWLASSPSGSVSLSISLQEDKIFLACPNTSVSSYRDNDGSSREESDSTSQPSTSQATASSSSPLIPSLSNSQNDKNIKKRVSTQRSLHLSSLPMDSKPSDLPSSILRGSLLMKLTKPTKIKDISVRFYGKCKTDWLESNIEDELMLGGSQFYDEVTISSHSWKYVNTPLGSTDHSSIVTIGSTSVISTNLFGADVVQFQPTTKKASVVAEASTKLEFKKKNPDHDINLPLFTPNYFQPEKTKTGVHPDLTSVVSQGSSTVYPAGQYVFNFNLAIDARTADTTICSFGDIKYFLVAKVSRPSRFAMNISCQREVELIRSPPNLADMSAHGPLSISRDWNNRLRYEISSPHSYIPVGSPIPLSIKLTPLEKVCVHRVKVHIIEEVTYISSWVGQMKHKEPIRKVLCFYKSASGSTPTKKKKGQPGASLLELEEGSFAGTTEFDASMARTTPSITSQNFLRPDVLFNPLIHVKHRLHVSFRISKQESYDPERKYYEVLVDVPIHFLSPQCKADSIQLPQYVEFYDRTASLPTAHDDRYAPNEDVEAEFGQPLVHALSSQLSRSSELSSSAYAINNFPYIDFIPPDDESMLPSFDLSQEIQRRRASSTTHQCQPDMIFLSPQQLASRQRRESSSSESSVFTSSDESIINDTPPNYNSVVNQTNLMSSVMGQVSGS